MPIEKDKISYLMELKKFRNWKDVPEEKRDELKKDIFDMVKLQIHSYTSEQRSPVTGGRFQKLSPEYAKIKKKMGKGTKADLHLKDKMINSIRSDYLKDSIRFKITAESQKAKSYNHLVGDTTPKRQFLPNEADSRGKKVGFEKGIKEAIQDMINDASGS